MPLSVSREFDASGRFWDGVQQHRDPLLRAAGAGEERPGREFATIHSRGLGVHDGWLLNGEIVAAI